MLVNCLFCTLPSDIYFELEFGITEWESGTFGDRVFFELDWKTAYFGHLADLNSFEKAMERLNVLHKLCARLLELARYVLDDSLFATLF